MKTHLSLKKNGETNLINEKKYLSLRKKNWNKLVLAWTTAVKGQLGPNND